MRTVKPGDDPRRLAGWMTDPKNEYFAGAMVNRLWRHFLGVGLVEPVDDLRASKPADQTRPCWRRWCDEFVAHGFDLRHLMRLILNIAYRYQSSRATRPANEADGAVLLALLRPPAPGRVLLDAISQATGVPDQFPGTPVGLRAISYPTRAELILPVAVRPVRAGDGVRVASETAT